MVQKKCKNLFPFPDFVKINCVYKGLCDTGVLHLVVPSLPEVVEHQGVVPEGFDDEWAIGFPALAVHGFFLGTANPTAFGVKPCFYLCLNVVLGEGLNQDAIASAGKLVDKVIGWNLAELVLLVRVMDVDMSFHWVASLR